MRKLGIIVLVLMGFTCGITYLYSCGDGNSGSDSGILNLDLGSQGQGIVLTADETLSMIFTDTYDVRNLGGPFGAFGLNLQDNLPWLNFSPQGLSAMLSERVTPLQAGTGQMWIYIDLAEAVSTVCTSENVFGPFKITLDDSYQPSSVSPAADEASQSAVDIINMGSFSICIRVVVPVDAEVGLDRVGFQVEDCGEPPADIEGTWTGPFTCESNCGSISDTVTLVITQDPADPSVATYEDSVAYYEGTVCGNRFNFSGGSASSSESGTFILVTSNTATKTSTYRSYSGECTGDCSDTLTRVD